MFTLPGNIKVLNLPEQVEKNTKDIVGLNQKDKLTDNALASFNIILNSQIEKVSKLENDIADLNQKSEYADTNITNLQSQTASNATKISTLENNTTSANGTITTGTLDVKNNATFGKVIVNSADDITDKDGNAIVKNESLDEFKRNYFMTEARYKYAGCHIQHWEEYESTPFDNQYTDVSQMYSYATFLTGVYPSEAVLPSYSSATHAEGFCEGTNCTYIEIGSMSPNGTNMTWAFGRSSATRVSPSANAKIYPTSFAFMFCQDPNLEEIGAFDMSMGNIGMGFIATSPKVKHIHCIHFKVSFNISESTAFEQSDLVEIISNLDPVTTAQTLTMGATNLAKLTQDQILVATGKGWTLA